MCVDKLIEYAVVLWFSPGAKSKFSPQLVIFDPQIILKWMNFFVQFSHDGHAEITSRPWMDHKATIKSVANHRCVFHPHWTHMWVFIWWIHIHSTQISARDKTTELRISCCTVGLPYATCPLAPVDSRSVWGQVYHCQNQWRGPPKHKVIMRASRALGVLTTLCLYWRTAAFSFHPFQAARGMRAAAKSCTRRLTRDDYGLMDGHLVPLFLH